MKRIALAIVLSCICHIGHASVAGGQDYCESWGDYEPSWSPDGRWISASGWLFHGPPLYFLEFWVRAYEVVDDDSLGGALEIQYGGSTRPTWIREQPPEPMRLVYGRGNQIVGRDPTWDRVDEKIVAEVGCVVTDPAASPDDKWIAFACPDNNLHSLYTVNVQTGGVHRLTEGAVDIHPAWSRDGRFIVFASDRNGSFDLWQVPSAGGEPTFVHGTAGSETWPAWSPNGEFLAFTSDADGSDDIWVLPRGATQALRITDSPGAETGPAWAPQGTRIAYRSDNGECTRIEIIPVPRIVSVSRSDFGKLKKFYR